MGNGVTIATQRQLNFIVVLMITRIINVIQIVFMFLHAIKNHDGFIKRMTKKFDHPLFSFFSRLFLQIVCKSKPVNKFFAVTR